MINEIRTVTLGCVEGLRYKELRTEEVNQLESGHCSTTTCQLMWNVGFSQLSHA